MDDKKSCKLKTFTKGALPFGWVVMPSKNHPDRVYYFNMNTGCSTWDCPVVNVPMKVDDAILEVPKKEEESAQVVKETGIINNEGSSEEELAKINFSSPSFTENCDDVSEIVEQSTSPHTFRTFQAIITDTKCDEKLSKQAHPTVGIVYPTVVNVSEPSCSKSQASIEAVNQASDIETLKSKPSGRKRLVTRVKKILKTAVKKKCVKKCSRYTKIKKTKDAQTPDHHSHQSFKNQNCTKLKKKSKSSSSSNNSSFSHVEDIDRRIYEEFLEEGSPAKVLGEMLPAIPVLFEGQTKEASTSTASENGMTDDVEMLDVSADLTTIRDLNVTAQESDKCSYYLVIDTNVLLYDLAYINEIKDTALKGTGLPHIFIPWIVVQELDSLKKKPQTSKSAKEAVIYLNSILRAKHPRFHCQSPQEADDWAKSYSQNNDDKILECCMKLAEKMPKEKVILVTNDKALVTKALICDISVHNVASLINTLTLQSKSGSPAHKRESFKSSSKKLKKKPYSREEPGLSNKQKQSSSPLIEREEVKIPDYQNMDIHTLMSKARELLKNTLDAFLVEEMNEAYRPDIWKAFSIDRSLLKDILKAISKYWRAVYSLKYSLKDKRNFDLLLEKASRPEGFLGDKKECIDILTAIEDVFYSIKRKKLPITVPIAEIQCLRISFINACLKLDDVSQEVFQELITRKSPFSEMSDSDQKISQPSSPVKKQISNSNDNIVLDVLNKNWRVLNNVCGLVMEFYKIPYDFPYDQQNYFDDESIPELLVTVFPLVVELRKIMRGIVGVVKTFNPRKNIFTELYNALEKLIPSLDLNIDGTLPPHFSPDTIEKFCRSEQNKQAIEIGSKQMSTFYETLEKAVKQVKKTQHNKD